MTYVDTYDEAYINEALSLNGYSQKENYLRCSYRSQNRLYFTLKTKNRRVPLSETRLLKLIRVAFKSILFQYQS